MDPHLSESHETQSSPATGLEAAPDEGNSPRMFARVLPDQAAGKILDYRVPEAMSSKIAVGSRVKIPVRTRLLARTVIELLNDCEFHSVKDITDLLDERPMIRPALLELAYWMADYYCCPLETAVCSVLPVAVRDGRVTAKKQNTVRLAREFT